MIGACPRCGAELGPHEDPDGCLTCQGVPLRRPQDRVVGVLETARSPVKHWDVKRLLESRYERTFNRGSVQVWLSTDPRNCWGGPGIYGLYRHGLLPGVRDLGTAAAVFMRAADLELTQDEARFMLQHIGYRFQASSIYLALRRVEDAGLLKRRDGMWRPTNRSAGPLLGLWYRSDVDVVLHRASEQAVRAIADLERRLGERAIR